MKNKPFIFFLCFIPVIFHAQNGLVNSWKNNITKLKNQSDPKYLSDPPYLKTNSAINIFWVPQIEKHYIFNNSTNQWNLSDSTRYYYHSSPPAWNGLIKYFLNYDLLNNTISKDTFDYNSNGNETLHKIYTATFSSTPVYTINFMKKQRYYPFNLIKGSTQYQYFNDMNNCMGNGPVNTLVYTSKDTSAYNLNNRSLFKIEYSYDVSICGFVPNQRTDKTRNANDLITTINYSTYVSPNWVPQSKDVLKYNPGNDTIKAVTNMTYNTMSSQYDSVTKVSVKWYLYDKYEPDNNSIFKSLTFYNFNSTSQTFTPSSKWVVDFDSNGNLILNAYLSWNGSSFDTTYSERIKYYYKPSTSAIDTEIVMTKTTNIGPYSFDEKFIYSNQIQIVGIPDYLKQSDNFRIFPVPADNYLSILDPSSRKINSIKISTITGSVIYQSEKLHTSDISIPIGNLSKGIYIISIMDNEGIIFNKKFIKN